MAIRVRHRLRALLTLAAAGVTVAAVVALPAIASASPHATHDKPKHHHHHQSIASVQKQLGHLALRNDQLVEKFDQAQVLVHKRDKAAAVAEARARAATVGYQRAHSDFAQVIQQQYEDTSFGAAGALLDSNGGNNYLDRLNTLDMVSAHTAQVVSTVADAKTAAQHSAATARSVLAAATAQRDRLGAQRRSVGKQIAKYQSLLATLSAAQRAAYEQAANHTVDASSLHDLPAASSAAARRAVEFALKQVGKPYVFGAAGPGSYDCSGLTMMSWRQGGVSLPHSAAEQYNYGHHVSRSQLQPGDLIFFYQPIGHVTIYIGDGMMVSAPTEGENVQVVPLSEFNSDYTGATRLTR